MGDSFGLSWGSPARRARPAEPRQELGAMANGPKASNGNYTSRQMRRGLSKEYLSNGKMTRDPFFCLCLFLAFFQHRFPVFGSKPIFLSGSHVLILEIGSWMFHDHSQMLQGCRIGKQGCKEGSIRLESSPMHRFSCR